MNVQEISQLVSNVGFPIAMCLMLIWYMTKETTRHKEETDKLSNTIASNTQVLTELCTLIKTLVK